MREIALATAVLVTVAARGQSSTVSFMDNTAPGWVLGGTGYTPILTSGSIDPSGQGWLRLTDNSQDLATYAYNNTAIASQNTTIYASFDFTSWNQGAGGAADGIGFFLFDGSQSFSIGANGGSLGYAQKPGVNGMGGGYLGVALDDWGNFSNPTESRIGGPGQIPNAIAVRGPGSGTSGYAYVAGTSNGGVPALSSELDFPTYTTRPTGANEARHIALTLSPANQLSVSISFGTNAPQSLYIADLSAYTRPDTLKFGFSAANGGAAEIHEIRNLQVSSVAANLWDNGGGSTAWGTAANWNPNALPAAGGDVIFNNAFVSTAQTVDLGAGVKDVRTVSLDAPFGYTLQNGTLNFDAHGAPGQLSLTASAITGDAAQTVNANITTTADLLLKNTASSLLTFGGTMNNGGRVLNFDGTGNVLASGVISGSGSLSKFGSGTLTLSGNNTYSGGTTLNAGTLALANNNALGTGSLIVNDGVSMQASGGARTIGNAATLQGNATISGADNLTLSGAWTQSGGNRTVTVNNTGTTTFSGGINLSESNTGRTLTMEVAAGSSATVSGVIANGGSGAGGLTKTGDGTLTLSGANTYTGTTTVNAGVLGIGASDRLSDASALALSGGTFALNGSYSERVGSLAYNNGTVDFGAAGTANNLMFDAPGSNAGTLSILNWETSQDRLAVLTAATVSAGYLSGIYFSGYGSGAQISATSQTIAGYGTGIWSYITPATATFDTWDGGSTVNNNWSSGANWVSNVAPGNSTTERMAFDGTTRLSPNMDANWTVNTLRFNSTAGAFTIGSTGGRTLTFDGTVPSLIQQSVSNQVISTAVRLNQTTIIDTAGAGNLTLSGVVSGAGGLTKVNEGGKLILSGANTFTGATAIQGGVVNMQNAAALGATSAAATVSDGAALELQGGIAVGAKALTLNGSGISNGGVLRNISGNNSWSGAVTLNSDSRINSDAGTLTLSGAIGGSGKDLTVGGAGNVTLSGVIGTGAGGLTVDGSGTVTLSGSGANTYTGNTVVNSGTLALNKTAGTAAIAGNVSVGSSGTLKLLAANQITDSAVINMSGAGSFDLNGFSETISAVNSASTSSTLKLGAGTLTVNSFANSTFAGVLSGTGSLVKSGADTMTLSGANTYSGATTVSVGVLNIRNGSALGTSAAGTTVSASGAALQVQNNITVTGEALTLNGTGVAGTGALRNMQDNNTWTGTVTLASDTRINSDAGTLTLSGNVTSGANANLTAGGSGNLTLSGTLTTGAGGLTKDGTGTLTLSGASANTSTGNVTVNAGTLTLQKTAGVNAIAGSGNTLAINTGGTLLLNANNQIADGVKVTLGGGTFDVNTRTETVGALTLTDNSAINFSALAGSYGSLSFAASDASLWTSGKTLYIYNYNDNGGASSDYLYFGSSASGLGSGGPMYSQVVFVNPNGTTGNYPGMIESNGRIRPVPEPATVATIVLLAAGLLYRERKALAGLLSLSSLLRRVRQNG